MMMRLWPLISPRRAGAAAVAVAVAIALWSQPADWGRRPWSDPYRPQIPQALQEPAIYLLLDKPLSYIAPLLPPQSRFYQLADIALPIVPGGMFDKRIRDGLADKPAAGVWAMTLRGTAIRENLVTRYGLTIDPSRPCVTIPGVVSNMAVEACPLTTLRQSP